MQPTTVGQNRTGAARNPAEIGLMLEAVEELSPQMPIDTAPIEAERLKYFAHADSVGSIPPPASLLKGTMKKTVASLNGVDPNLLLDKIGERIAFERAGTRLYDALIAKYQALSQAGEGESPLGADAPDGQAARGSLPAPDGENPLETLRRIREEEHGHFQMLCEVTTKLGGDPTAQTPCADVAATATMGVLQVITDPRTTLAQCFNAALVAELTDTASWELLGELATLAAEPELSRRFSAALEAEQKHLATVQAWLRALTLHASGTRAV
jgi:rubrerythrin